MMLRHDAVSVNRSFSYRQSNADMWQPSVSAVHIAGLVMLAVLTPLHRAWPVQLIFVPFLLTFPGVLLLRALHIPGKVVADQPIYLPSAALIVLTGSGFAVNLVGPILGISEPLRAVPLLVGLEIVCAALFICSAKAPPQTQIPWSSLSSPVRLAWPLVFPLVSAAGALQLNNGHSNHLAVIAIVATLMLLVAVFLGASQLNEALLTVVLFASGLGMMWSFSLRGASVYGSDISSEFYWFHQTVMTGVWHFSHPNDAYGAMLSVTVLPAELHALSGIPDLMIFKVFYPVIGALLPVAVYSLGRQVLAQRWAFTAGTFVVVQQTFFQQFPALAREEVATILFVTLIVVILDTTLGQRARRTLIILLSLGMVVSHYSTAYLAITLLGIAIAFQFGVSWFRPIPRLSGAMLLAFVVSTAGATVWYGQLTHSASNVHQFIAAAKGEGLNLLPNRNGSLLSTYLQGEMQKRISPDRYQPYISGYYKKTYKFVRPLPDAIEPQYSLRPASDQVQPVRWALGSKLLNLADLLITQLTNLLAGIGALMLALRRRAPGFVRQIGLIGLAAMVILALTRLSGTIAQEYNPERAFLQMMVVLSIAVFWPFQRIGAKWQWTRLGILTAGVASLAALLVASSGLSGIALGGAMASNLSNSSDDFQEFVVSAPAISAASWVTKAALPGQLIYADSYGKLQLNEVTEGRTAILDTITPQTLDQHAWVYASPTNIIDNIVRSSTSGYVAVYAFPKLFLDSNFNVVYTNGTSEVFHR
jgi:uncharacterized membrane protein